MRYFRARLNCGGKRLIRNLRSISRLVLCFIALRNPGLLKTILSALAITVTVLLNSCSWFGPAEKYKTESGRTTYRAAEENPATRADVTPAPQRIPGESRR